MTFILSGDVSFNVWLVLRDVWRPLQSDPICYMHVCQTNTNLYKSPLHQIAAYCEQIILRTITSDNVIELTGQLQVQNSVRYAKMISSEIIPNRR